MLKTMGRAKNPTDTLVLKRGRRRLLQAEQHHTLLSPTPTPEALAPLEAAIADIQAGLTDKAQKLLGRHRGYLESGYVHLDRLADAVLDKLASDNAGETITGYARRRLMLLGAEQITDPKVAFKANHGDASSSRPRVMHLRRAGTEGDRGKFVAACGSTFTPSFVRRGLWDAIDTGLGVSSDTLEFYRRCQRCEAKEEQTGYKSTQVRFNPLDRDELRQLRRAALNGFIDASGNLLSVAASAQEALREQLAAVAVGRLADKPSSWWAISYPGESVAPLHLFFKRIYPDLAAMPAPDAQELEGLIASLSLPSTMYELVTPGEAHGFRHSEAHKLVLPKLLQSTWPEVLELIAREISFDEAQVLPYTDDELRRMADKELRELVEAAKMSPGPALAVRLMPGTGRWEIFDRALRKRTSQHVERQAAVDLATFELKRRRFGGRLYFDDGDLTYVEVEHDPAA